MSSIRQRMISAPMDDLSKRQVMALLESLRADLQNLANQYNQLRTDYNANANIVTDTTATAVTVTTQI